MSARPARRRDLRRYPGFGTLTWVCLVFLYAPILVMAIYSFNKIRSITTWGGFSFDWYAKAIGNALDKVLERAGFDRAVERGGVKRALERTKYDASGILGKLVFYLLFLFVLQLAFGVFGPNPISDMLEAVIAYIPRVIAAILIIVVASAIAAAVREMVDAALGNLGYGRVLANVAGAAVLTVGIFAALSQLEIAPAILNAVFYGLDWIATVPPTVRLTSEAFGRENTGVIYGWIGASHQLGASVAAFGAGAIRTMLGGYQVAFWAAGLLCVVAGLSFLTIGRSLRPVAVPSVAAAG